MTTTNSDFNLPDIKELEKLANQFFAALPGSDLTSDSYNLQEKSVNPIVDHNALTQQSLDLENPQTSLPDPHFSESGHTPKSLGGVGLSPSSVEKGNSFNISEPQTSLPDPHFTGSDFTPKSLGGVGLSPSSVEKGNPFNINEPQTSLPDPHFTGSDFTPKSMGGLGVSPSALEKGNPFNINEPQTSLPDPHFTGSDFTPKSMGGLGVSPSALNNVTEGQEYSFGKEKATTINPLSATPFSFTTDPFKFASANQLPYESDQPFEAELKEALKSISVSEPSSQLPYSNTAFSESSFYFLSGSNYFPVKEVFNPYDKNASDSKSYTGTTRPPLNFNLIKQDFPILQEKINGRPIIWLDNAATTQKPKQVIERLSYFYEHENSNIHRAAHELAARATDAYEAARKKVQVFLNAKSVNEIVFVRGATEAINLVAQSWGDQNLKPGDEIIISYLEHHANIVPWQRLAEKKGLKLRVIPVDDDGQVILDEYAKLLNTRTKLVSFTQVSNALGTVTPAKQIVEMAHQVGARVLVDGAQAVSHMRADVQALDSDWYVFSGHKVFGPTGIGVLYGKEELLNATQPWQGGGNMIADVTFEHTKYNKAPSRFEAGTGNIADAVGLGAAIDYVNRIGIDLIQQYEHYLLVYATKLLKDIPGLRLIGTALDKAGVLSFVLDGYKTEDVGAALNKENIAVRSGHHCAQPILRRFGVESTVRPSLAFYNTCADIDALIEVLHKLTAGRNKK